MSEDAGFCEWCGAARVMVASWKHSATDGSQILESSCQKCVKGCYHRFETKGFPGRSYCILCGVHDWMADG